MRSAEHVLWDAHMEVAPARAAADGFRRALEAVAVRWTAAMRDFAESCRRLSAELEHMQVPSAASRVGGPE